MSVYGSILALDLGIKTGWALRPPAGNICYGTQEFKTERFSGGGMRYLRFTNWLREITAGVERIAYEEVRRHLSTDSAHAYGGFMATLTAFCESNKIPYEGIPVGTIKKFATNRGNAGKPEMIAAAVAAGFSPEDDNAADALHILRFIESRDNILKNNFKPY